MLELGNGQERTRTYAFIGCERDEGRIVNLFQSIQSFAVPFLLLILKDGDYLIADLADTDMFLRLQDM